METPFKLSAPQELVTLKLLGIDLTKLVELTPNGYEVLTTHVIKCALAAASVVKLDSRPTVKEMLHMIGFQPQERFTDPDVITAWEELSNWQSIFHTFSTETTEHRETHFTSVPLEAVEDEKGNIYCQIDKSFYNLISAMRLPDNGNTKFFAPLASVNFGNSSVFDGCVVFHMRHKTKSTQVKATIMSMSKDYATGTKLTLSKLKEHANHCNDEVFDGVLGKNRLMRVSARASVVEGKRTSVHGRPFVPFMVNNSKILGSLLVLLDEKRTPPSSRKNARVAIVDKGGKDVTNTFEPWQ
eukprot:scaffold173295_cov41-Attheya_sp.AAC.4